MAIHKEFEKAYARFKEAERMKKEAEVQSATWQQEAAVVGEAVEADGEGAAKKTKTDAARGRPAAMSSLPSPSRLRAQTGTMFDFVWEGDGVIKHDSDQGYVSTYYRAFSRKLQRGGTEEIFKVGDSVQLYGAECHADMQLAVLQDMFEDSLGTMWVRLNWYYLPVEVPEAALNGADGGPACPNEVFRSNHMVEVEVSRIRAKIVVRNTTPEEQADAGLTDSRDQRAAAAGWVTWRSYDVYKKRVRPTCDAGANDDDEGDSDADGMFSSESESDEEDRIHGHAVGTGPPAKRYLQEQHISEGGTQTKAERQLGLREAPRLMTDGLAADDTPANSGEAAADGEGGAADDTPANSGDAGGGDAAQGSGAEGDTKRKHDGGSEDEERKKKRKKHKKKKRKKHKKRKPQGKMPMAEIDKKVAAALEAAKSKNTHEELYECQSQKCKPGGIQHHVYERDCLYRLHVERFGRPPGGRPAKCVVYMRKLLDEDDPTRINGDRMKRGTVSSESSSSESESESESS